MMRLAMAAVVAAGLVVAAGSAVAQGVQGSAYCGTASGKLLLDVKNHEQIPAICKPGDILYIPASFGVVIGKYCDFSKSMVSADRYVYCVFGANRPIR